MKNASVLKKQPQPIGVTPGQIQEMNFAALRGMTEFYNRLLGDYAQRFVGNPSLITNAVAQALEALLPKRMIIPHEKAEWWQKYYHDDHGIKCVLGELEIPATPAYPARLIIMHADVSSRPQRIATVYNKRCSNKWWQYAGDLDVSVPRHVRSGTYGVWVADVPEASDGFEIDPVSSKVKNLSSQDIWDRGWTTITLPERLIDGDTYLLERQEHLDRRVITLCAGSRCADGDVPGVRLDDDGWVYAHDWDPRAVGDRLRYRRAVV